MNTRKNNGGCWMRRAPVPCSVALLLGMLQLHDAGAAAVAPADGAATTAAEPETTDLGKITVHTRNRLEPLQDVPVSVSVVTGAELDRLDAFDITAIVRRVGDLQWIFGIQRTSSLALRGFGKQKQTKTQNPNKKEKEDGKNYAY